MSGMDKILKINGEAHSYSPYITGVLITLQCIEADGDLICQSGARWEDINQTLKDEGIPLFFPVCAIDFDLDSIRSNEVDCVA